MEINILHLYYDLLNLYGENGNVRCLKKKLEEQNIMLKEQNRMLKNLIRK